MRLYEMSTSKIYLAAIQIQSILFSFLKTRVLFHFILKCSNIVLTGLQEDYRGLTQVILLPVGIANS